MTDQGFCLFQLFVRVWDSVGQYLEYSEPSGSYERWQLLLELEGTKVAFFDVLCKKEIYFIDMLL